MKKLNNAFALLVIASIILVIAALAAIIAIVGQSESKDQVPPPKPALVVTVTLPQITALPIRIQANGSITPWQEASIGTEANGLRLAEVRVNVGDFVKRGQVVATFAASTVRAELSQSRAARAEAEATLAEATANAQRARDLQASGVLSAQQISQYLTAELTASARVESAKATTQTQELRLAQTEVLAPDDGVISARSATVGAVFPNGQELFRIIRKGRLEWRAEVAAPELARLKPGQITTVTPVGGEPIKGTLRMVAPIVDTQTRNGLVYVDLAMGSSARAGMFARGEIEIGEGIQALTLPQTAVLQRDGFNYVLRVGPDSKVTQTKVKIGRRVGDRVEVLEGIDIGSRVVAKGGAFLGNGDLVLVAGSPTNRGSAPKVALNVQ